MPNRLPNHVIFAIVSLFKDGHLIQDIAKITGVKVRSVRRWVKRYRDGNCPIPLSNTDTKRPRVKSRTPATNDTTLTIIKGHTDSKPRQPHKQLKAGSPQLGAVSVKGQAQRRIHDFLSYGSCSWPTRDGSSPRVLQSSKIRGQFKWNYTPEQRKSAVKAVVDGGLSLCKASLIYGVPRGTLWNAIFPKQSSARSVTVSSSSSASSSSSSSCSSGASRSSPYPLRRHSAPMDSSRSPNNSPYHFRKHLNVRQSVLASSHGKSPLTSRSKDSVTPATPTSNSATSTEALQRGKSAKDVGRSKVRGRRRYRGKAEYRGSACCFCGSAEDNTVLLGKMCHMRDLHVHYYCLLFSSGLPQNGEDDEGILGFLEDDIMKEILRGKKLSCSYCLRKGATIGCVEKKCKRTYHFPCGLKYNALCMFTNDYRSYCSQHREYQSGVGVGQIHQCPICLETLVADPKRALWAPCCQRNSWFHKVCLQTLALSAGYFFKCPLCNDREIFMPEMKKQGIYVPEQDASWELEPNAFNELLERPIHCDAAKCACPNGRSADVDGTWWEVLLCSLCGSTGVHVRCGGLPFTAKSWSCSECLSTTGAVSDTPSDTPARSTRHCTRRAREAGEEEVGGDDGSVSPKRIKLEKSKEASPLEAAVRDGDSSSVSPDTVLWKLEELGEEVPLVLQQLKDRVRLAHARMKELRLTEREVVRAAQRISATAVTPGQQPLVDRKASSPFSTTSHTQPTSQPPKLSLFKNQVLHEKGQLTLVGMHHSSTPAAAPAPSPDTDQTDKPPCQTFSLDKAHLLALWRCALPVARIEEVLLILETVFSEREAEVAKAAITRASRQRPSPRTTPSRKYTRATRCITSTTNTTSWKAWPTTHSPVAPQSTSGNPTALQNKSQEPATPQSSMKQPIVLQSSSQQPATLLSPSQQPATLHSPSQQPATLQSPSQQPTTLLSPSQQPATLLSPSQQPATLQNSSQQLAIPQSPSQQPVTLQSPSQQSATLQSPLQCPATLHNSSQKPTTQHSPSLQPATPPSASQQPTTPSASQQSTTPLSASQPTTTLSASQQPTPLSSASLQAATPSCATQQSETPCSRTFGTQCSESHQLVTPHSESSHPRTPHNDVHQPNTQQDSSPLFIRMNRGLHWSDAKHSETQREVQESCVTATSHVTCVGVSEESSQPRSACRRLLLQPRTSIITRNSKTDKKDSAGCEEGATGDTASDRVAPPSLAITVEDPATTSTTTTTTTTTNNNNSNNNSNRAAASDTLQMTSTFTASAFPPPPLHHKVDSSPSPRSLNSSRTGLPPSSKKSAPPPNPPPPRPCPRPPYSCPLLPLPSLSPLLDLSLQYTPSSSSSSSSLVASNLLPTLPLRQHLFHPFIQYPPFLLAPPRHSSLLPTPPRHASLLPTPPRHPSLLLTPMRHPLLLPAPPRHPSVLPAPTRHPSLLPTPPRCPSSMQPYSLPSPSLFVFHKFFPPSY